ncbi:hypothetical protein D9M71_180320 [compost metagenome]
MVVDHGVGKVATVAAPAPGVIDKQIPVRLPGDPHTIVETLDTERFTFFQKTFTIARDHFVQGNGLRITIQVNQIGLKALAAFMKSDDQRIAALVQHPQVRGDLHGCAEHFWRLRCFFRELGIRHG